MRALRQFAMTATDMEAISLTASVLYSLSGGRGNVRNVMVGALLIGVLVNGMTILDIQYTIQNVIKSLILLFAIVADSIINPRDEQTGQQGDI